MLAPGVVLSLPAQVGSCMPYANVGIAKSPKSVHIDYGKTFSNTEICANHLITKYLD